MTPLLEQKQIIMGSLDALNLLHVSSTLHGYIGVKAEKDLILCC